MEEFWLAYWIGVGAGGISAFFVFMLLAAAFWPWRNAAALDRASKEIDRQRTELGRLGAENRCHLQQFNAWEGERRLLRQLRDQLLDRLSFARHDAGEIHRVASRIRSLLDQPFPGDHNEPTAGTGE